jgi:NADPH oxidase
MRHYFYNLFWYTHQVLAALFIIFFCVHGLQGVVRKQINLDRHDPEKCYQYYTDWPFSQADRVCDIPKFTSNSATSWIWVIGPITLYFVERFARFIRGLVKHKIVKYVIHPSNVLELVIDNSGKVINYRAGQYIFININELSWFEWHPFTITSAPGDKYLTVHIRSAGDWTENLVRSIVSKDSGDTKPGIKQISIDGAYGTCAEDILKYETVVLIGAGIGVTPYASILKYIWHKLGSNRDSLHSKTKLRKVFFFWVCPSIDTFEWFGVLLQDLEKEMIEKADHSLLEYKLYVTRGWSSAEAKQIAINHNETIDLFTGLRQKTNYGRPNFDAFFKDLAEQRKSAEDLNETSKLRKRDNIGVFFCGPQALSYELHKICNKYSNEETRFIYNKENF